QWRAAERLDEADQRDVHQPRFRQPSKPDQQADDQAQENGAAGIGEGDEDALPEQRRVTQQEGEGPLIEHRLASLSQNVSVDGICSRVTPNLVNPSSSHSRICPVPRLKSIHALTTSANRGSGSRWMPRQLGSATSGPVSRW